jgi:hypothetical protein
MQTTFDIEDDLFSRPPRTARRQLMPTARITCRVCGLRSEVTLDNAALLCQPCRVDPVHTRLHVEQTLAAVERRWEQAVEAFDIRAEQPEVAEKWATIEAARLSAAPALFLEAWRRRKAAGGPLGELLAAKEALDELSDEVQRQRAWATSALGELDAYEDSAAAALAQLRAGEGQP